LYLKLKLEGSRPVFAFNMCSRALKSCFINDHHYHYHHHIF
jgi:hypothetical protein